MFDPIVIGGIGVVGGFGAGVAALEQTLTAPPGPNATVDVKNATGIHSLACHRADVTPLELALGWRALRRVDRLSQLTTLAAYLALEDAGETGLAPNRIGIVLATGYGSSDTTFRFSGSCLDDGPELGSPLLFSSSGNSAPLSNVTILLDIRGPALTVCQPELPLASALTSAVGWIREGRVDAVLVGGVDECFPVRDYIWHSRFGATSGAPMRPFDFDHDSPVMGEGSAFFLLTPARAAVKPTPALTAISHGHTRDGLLLSGESACVLLGANGHRQCGQRYREVLPPNTPVAAFAPLFGSFPAAMALNLAIAAIACRRGQLAAPPAGDDAPPDLIPITGPLDLCGRSLTCLDCSGSGRWFAVDVRPLATNDLSLFATRS